MEALTWIDNPSTTNGIYFAPEDSGADWLFVSYAELAADAYRMAALLIENGLARGDVVSILSSDPRTFVTAFYGSLVAGGTASPIATPLTFRSFDAYVTHIAEILRSAAPSIVLAEQALLDTAVAATHKALLDSDVICLDLTVLPQVATAERRATAEHLLLQFTSGSSGTPKGVPLSRGNLSANISANLSWVGGAPDQVSVSWLPAYHDMGLIGMLLSPIAAGWSVRLLTPGQFLRSPLRWLECLGSGESVFTASPSFGYAYTAQRVRPDEIEKLDFTQWRMAILGAERVDPIGLENFLDLTSPRGFSAERMNVGYGLAEATLTATAVRPGNVIPLVQLERTALRDGEPVPIIARSVIGDEGREGGIWIAGCGAPLDGTEVDIIDDQGVVVPDGHLGQIRLRSGAVSEGYRSVHAQTSTAFTAAGLHTGDSGFMLDGELYVIGRMGDSIKVRGVNLYAEDLDVKIRDVTGLNPGRYATLLGVVGSNDAVVVIVESDEIEWLDAVKTVVASISSNTMPLLVFRGERGSVQRTSSGKPRRRVLWQRLLDGDMPVRLVHSNWESVTQDPSPWRKYLEEVNPAPSEISTLASLQES